MGRSDGFLADRLPELVAVAAVVIPGLVVTVLVALLAALLAAAIPGSAGLAGTAFGVVVGLGVVGTLLLAVVTWVAVGRARREVRPRAEDARVAWYRRARRLESMVPPARALGLSGRLEPDEETIIAALRRRYVSGEIDERQFERELERLLGDGASDAVAVRRETTPAADASAEDADRDASLDRQLDG